MGSFMTWFNSGFINQLIVIGVAFIMAVLVYKTIDTFRRSKQSNQPIPDRPNKDILPVISARTSANNAVRSVDNHPEPEPQEAILPDNTPGAPLAVVNNIAKRSWGLHSVRLIPGKDYGRQWLYLTHQVFWLNWTNGQFTTVIPPEDMDNSPSRLYKALNTKEYVAETIAPRREGDKKAKMTLLIVAAIVAMFLMYLAVRGG